MRACRRVVGLVALLPLLGGCSRGRADVADGFERELTHREGCWDLLVGAQDATQDLVTMQMNLLWTAGHVCRAHEEGVAVEAEGQVGDPDGPTMELLVGFDLTWVCSDAELTDDIRRRYVATAGTVTLAVEPIQEDRVMECEGYADVTVRDVRFEDVSTGEAVELDRFEWRDLYVGWSAG